MAAAVNQSHEDHIAPHRGKNWRESINIYLASPKRREELKSLITDDETGAVDLWVMCHSLVPEKPSEGWSLAKLVEEANAILEKANCVTGAHLRQLHDAIKNKNREKIVSAVQDMKKAAVEFLKDSYNNYIRRPYPTAEDVDQSQALNNYLISSEQRDEFKLFLSNPVHEKEFAVLTFWEMCHSYSCDELVKEAKRIISSPNCPTGAFSRLLSDALVNENREEILSAVWKIKQAAVDPLEDSYKRCSNPTSPTADDTNQGLYSDLISTERREIFCTFLSKAGYADLSEALTLWGMCHVLVPEDPKKSVSSNKCHNIVEEAQKIHSNYKRLTDAQLRMFQDVIDKKNTEEILSSVWDKKNTAFGFLEPKHLEFINHERNDASK